MSLKCKWHGHQWTPRELVSITEAGSQGRRSYFAFKRFCSCCAAIEFSEIRDVVYGDHEVTEEQKEREPIPVIRRDEKGVPYPSVNGTRMRFSDLGGL